MTIRDCDERLIFMPEDFSALQVEAKALNRIIANYSNGDIDKQQAQDKIDELILAFRPRSGT